jgi:hypothetical protein
MPPPPPPSFIMQGRGMPATLQGDKDPGVCVLRGKSQNVETLLLLLFEPRGSTAPRVNRETAQPNVAAPTNSL